MPQTLDDGNEDYDDRGRHWGFFGFFLYFFVLFLLLDHFLGTTNQKESKRIKKIQKNPKKSESIKKLTSASPWGDENHIHQARIKLPNGRCFVRDRTKLVALELDD